MLKLVKLVTPFVAIALISGQSNAAETINVSCNVAVTVSGGLTPETYNKDFVLKSGIGFSDDFSTPTRQKQFNAVVAREAGNLVVSFDYFNDISTFDSVGFSARLTIVGGSATTSGTNDFATSLPSFRRYVTGYTLTCRKK